MVTPQPPHTETETLRSPFGRSLRCPTSPLKNDDDDRDHDHGRITAMQRRFAIVLIADTDPDPDAAVRRLRAILKALGRSYGIRCIDAREMTDPRNHRDRR